MTIIFDFDGTIADTLKLTLQLFNTVAPKYKLPQIKDSDVEELRNSSARELLKKYPLSPWKLLRLVNEIQSQLKKHIATVQPIPGMITTLHELKKANNTIGIVTSNSEKNVKLFLQKNKITAIDFFHTEKNLFGKGKVLSKVIKQKKLDKKEVLYVGDEVRDIEAAHSAGIKVIAVTWGFNSKQRLEKSNPDFLVSSTNELISISLSLSERD